MPDIGDGGLEAANHIAMYVPMQQSCMFCTCTPESKEQSYIYIYKERKKMETPRLSEDK